MIKDVPTGDDFLEAGQDFLNLGWNLLDSVISTERFLSEPAIAEDFTAHKEQNRRTQRELGMVALLLVQGLEFSLKARIASVNPFLLLSDLAKISSTNKSFGELLSVNAGDLPRLHDAVVPVPLSNSFVQGLTVLRGQRNRIAHTSDSTLKLEARALVSSYFGLVDDLYGDQAWKVMRRDWLCREPLGTLAPRPLSGHHFAREMERAIDHLEAAMARRHLGVDKKARRYCCPDCLHRDLGGEPPRTATTIERDGTNFLKCFCCDQESEIPSDCKTCSRCVRWPVLPLRTVQEFCIMCGYE